MAFACRKLTSVGATDDLQGIGQVIGVRRFELDVLTTCRVLKAQPHRVQPLALQADSMRQRRIGTVGQIAHAGVLQRAHVNPDLVGATSFEMDF